MPLASDTTCAGFRIVRHLGSGGMGEVYLAQHPRLPRRDALKVLPADVSADPEFRERFNREADLAAALWHPHIVGLHDRGEYEGQLWISMDYVDGSDAAKLLHDSYPDGMPADEVVEIVTAIADALDYAHDSGLLHRDVKPSNILITQPVCGWRRILLADFGIARRLDDISGLTVTNMAVGTMSYAAPEQLVDAPIDGRADQYALAATAFHLLTGSPPFRHSNPAVVIGKHLNGVPPKLSDTKPELAHLDAALARALSKDPADRFACCRDFAEALKGDRPKRRRLLRTRLAAGRPSASRIHPLVRAAVVVPTLVSLMLTGSVIVTGTRVSDARRSASPTAHAAGVPGQPQVIPAADHGRPPMGAPCAREEINTTTFSNSNTPIRCMSVRHGALWQPNAEVERMYPLIAGEYGWRNCLKEFPRGKCEAAAAVMAGAPGSTGPFIPPGTYAVPGEMSPGLYAAANGVAGAGCSWHTYDNAGNLLGAGNDGQDVVIGPLVARFSTAGCTPWVRKGRVEGSGVRPPLGWP
ncbi:serine/threonine-protein kinase [Mycobacterium kyorinense]|uniref:serine/threonine-protein kinase n=1 Tax=Mycobacterium kyorinense TaxID=487514 RepID=UPI0009DE5111|nr:serine/threonine-protein kinase [Mycobacterium kyorinense]